MSEETQHLRREQGLREMSAGITSSVKVDHTTLEVIKARKVESAGILLIPSNSPATPHGVIRLGAEWKATGKRAGFQLQMANAVSFSDTQ